MVSSRELPTSPHDCVLRHQRLNFMFLGRSTRQSDDREATKLQRGSGQAAVFLESAMTSFFDDDGSCLAAVVCTSTSSSKQKFSKCQKCYTSRSGQLPCQRNSDIRVDGVSTSDNFGDYVSTRSLYTEMGVSKWNCWWWPLQRLVQPCCLDVSLNWPKDEWL